MVVKKLFALAALALVVGGAADAVEAGTARTTARNSETRNSDRITTQKARDAAMDRVPNGTIARTEFSQSGGSGAGAYTLIMVDGSNRYNVTVDARSGEVTNVDQNPIISTTKPANLPASQTMPEAKITPERAMQLASQRVQGGHVVEVDRAMSNNRAVYNIEMVSDTSKVDMKMDADTGEILSYDEQSMDMRPGALRFERTFFERGASSNSANQPSGSLNR